MRILRTGREAPQGEETYRLLVDEIPQADPARTSGVRMQFRYSVPVSAGAPANAAVPKTDFTLQQVAAADGKNGARRA